MVTSALLCLAVWGATGEGAGAPPSLPEGVLAVVDGQEVRREAYLEYLWRVQRTENLRDYVDLLLLEKKARELGVTVSEEEVRAEVEEEIQRRVEGYHRGDVGRWRAFLAKSWLRPEDRRAQLAVSKRAELLLTKCVRATRTVTDEAVGARFERLYGRGGVDHELRQIVIRSSPLGARAPDPELEAKARSKAERILRELEDGADFAELVKLYSDDKHTRQYGGRIPKYRPGMYGSEEFDAAVRSLTEPGQLSGIVKTRRGFHIVQLLKRTVTARESVEEEIRTLLAEERPGTQEKLDFVEKLRKAAAITW
jgi:hypothetical protein